MARLFLRDVSVQIGTVLIRSRVDAADQAKPTLRVTFSIEKTGARHPNTCELAVYNLSKDNRTAVQQRLVPCIVEAGYAGERSQLFSGDLRFTTSKREGVDFVTNFTIGDGVKEYTSARFNENFGPGTAVRDIIEKIAGALGVGLGNVVEKLREGGFRAGFDEFTKGAVFSGQASEELDKLMRAVGLEWSIQNGQLQVLKPKETTKDPAIALNKASGLIGSPELGEDGIVRGRALLQGQLSPGRLIKLESLLVDGFFKLTKTIHTGDTWGADWTTEFEGTPL